MRKNKILILALLACLCIPVGAQNTDNGNITGVVVDKWGNPVYGASVYVVGVPDNRVETDKDGKFEIAAEAGKNLQVVTVDKGSAIVEAAAGKTMTIRTGRSVVTNRPLLFLRFITRTSINELLKMYLTRCSDKGRG